MSVVPEEQEELVQQRSLMRGLKYEEEGLRGNSNITRRFGSQKQIDETFGCFDIILNQAWTIAIEF